MPKPRFKLSPADANAPFKKRISKRKGGTAAQPPRKRARKNKKKKAGWTELGRGAYRGQGGTAVCGPVGQEEATCLSDATFVCMKDQGSTVTVTQARSYAPEAGYPSVADMRAFANDNGFEVEAAGNFSCNPQKVVMLTRGHYIVIVDMWDKDGKKSEHACALTEIDGEMFLVDNMARTSVIKIGPEDRVSHEMALEVFAGTDESMFPGAEKLIVRTVLAVRPL
eukprot:COSAG02_NODE_4965_length_4774_cov_8.825455_2_plen_224_part_00